MLKNQQNHKLMWTTIANLPISIFSDFQSIETIKFAILKQMKVDSLPYNKCFACEESLNVIRFNNVQSNINTHCRFCPIFKSSKCFENNQLYKLIQNAFKSENYEFIKPLALQLANLSWRN